MDHASPFYIFKFQEISNDIINFLIQWILTLTIALWRFRSPLGFQLPKWELIWECGGSFPHTLLHSWEHEMWLSVSLLAHTFINLCLGHEPKVRVVTIIFSFFCNLLFIANKYNEELCVHYHHFLCLFDYLKNYNKCITYHQFFCNLLFLMMMSHVLVMFF